MALKIPTEKLIPPMTLHSDKALTSPIKCACEQKSMMHGKTLTSDKSETVGYVFGFQMGYGNDL